MQNRKWIAAWLSLILFSIQAYGQWIDITDGLPDFGLRYAMDACSDSIAVVPLYDLNTGKEKLFQTQDFGNNWVEIPIPPGETHLGVDISVIDSDHIWILSGDKIYATSDRGATWDRQFYDTTKTKYLNYIEMFDLNYGVAMGDCADGRDGAAVILKTSDGGLNWVSVNDSAFGGVSRNIWWPIDFVDFDVGYFWPCLELPTRLYKTEDGGSTWTATNYPGSKMDIVKFYDENIGGGFTNVPDPRKDVFKSYLLSQNFPNSFNPQTSIPFTVARSCRVILKVFDVLGRDLVTLVDQDYARGEYNAVFHGEGFASGIYFYRIEMGDFRATRKMGLLD